MNNYNENDIRVAAYYNWLNSGCQNGNDLQNWNAAVAQIAGNISASATLKTSTRKINRKASASIAAGKALSKAIKMVAKKAAAKKSK